MSDQQPLPLKLQIIRLEHRDDDRTVHEVRISMAGLRQPLIQVDVESIFGDLPFIKTSYLCDPDRRLPRRVSDHLVFRAFEWLFIDLTGGGGTSFSRQFRCARDWIGRCFLNDEAEQIFEMLERNVIVGLPVRDETILQLD